MYAIDGAEARIGQKEELGLAYCTKDLRKMPGQGGGCRRAICLDDDPGPGECPRPLAI